MKVPALPGLQVRRANTEQASAQRVAAAADQVDTLKAEAAQAADRAASEATSTAARVIALEERLRSERAAAEQQQAASAERQASLEAELHAAARQVSALELQRQAAAATSQQEAFQAAEQAAHIAAQQAAESAASAAEQLQLATGEVVSLRHQLLCAEEQCGERECEAAAAQQRLAELEEQVWSDDARTPQPKRTLTGHSKIFVCGNPQYAAAALAPPCSSCHHLSTCLMPLAARGQASSQQRSSLHVH